MIKVDLDHENDDSKPFASSMTSSNKKIKNFIISTGRLALGAVQRWRPLILMAHKRLSDEHSQ